MRPIIPSSSFVMTGSPRSAPSMRSRMIGSRGLSTSCSAAGHEPGHGSGTSLVAPNSTRRASMFASIEGRPASWFEAAIRRGDMRAQAVAKTRLPRRGSTARELRVLGVDREDVARRVGEVESPAAGEGVDRLDDRPARGLDRRDAGLQVRRVEDHERLRVALGQAALLLALALDPGVLGAVLVQ